jgi:predicted P-loop ATPase
MMSGAILKMLWVRLKIACSNAKKPINDHFVDVNKMIPVAKVAEKLSRSKK